MEKSHYEYTEALDLERLLILLMAIVVRHRRLAGQANIKGPFYVKARLENMWRRVPFVDVPEFLKHISEFGFPLIQQADIFAPPGTSLDSFVVWPERDTPLSGDSIDAGAIDSIVPDMMAIGLTRFLRGGHSLRNHSELRQDNGAEIFRVQLRMIGPTGHATKLPNK